MSTTLAIWIFVALLHTTGEEHVYFSGSQQFCIAQRQVFIAQGIGQPMTECHRIDVSLGLQSH